MLKKKEKQHIVANEKAITLIALVVTIVILLILAGVTITMTLGQNGLFTRAREGRAAYEESEVRDDLSMLITQYTWDKVAEKTDKNLGDYLKENGATSVKANSDGTTLEVTYKGYTFKVNKDSGEITEVSKAGDSGETQPDPEVVVSGVKVTEDSAGQGSNVDEETIASTSGKKLYITFTSSIEGGTTTVSPAVPYEVSKNGSYKFTITGTVGSKTYTKEQIVIVNQYKDVTSALIGKVVSYKPDTPSTGYDLTEAKSGYIRDQTIDNQYDPTTWKITGSNTKYPAIYEQEKEESGSDDIYTTLPEPSETTGPSKTSLACIQTYYYFYNIPSSYFDDINFHSMIFGTKTSFWLASRWVDCTAEWIESIPSASVAHFGLRMVSYSDWLGNDLFCSNGNRYSEKSSLAPVVSLGSGIKIKSGEGTTEKPYIIGR